MRLTDERLFWKRLYVGDAPLPNHLHGYDERVGGYGQTSFQSAAIIRDFTGRFWQDTGKPKRTWKFDKWVTGNQRETGTAKRCRFQKCIQDLDTLLSSRASSEQPKKNQTSTSTRAESPST